MGGQFKHGILAANIGNTDLARLAETNPEAVTEISHIKRLMDVGEETKDEFLKLCRLLFEVGSIDASELLLRRNLECYQGHTLYLQLFGTTRQEEFDSAIKAFKAQFGVELTLQNHKSFLVSRYLSEAGTTGEDLSELLSRPCEITFGYIEKDRIEADVVLLAPGRQVFEADEWLLLFFANGKWEVGDPMID